MYPRNPRPSNNGNNGNNQQLTNCYAPGSVANISWYQQGWDSSRTLSIYLGGGGGPNNGNSIGILLAANVSVISNSTTVTIPTVASGLIEGSQFFIGFTVAGSNSNNWNSYYFTASGQFAVFSRASGGCPPNTNNNPTGPLLVSYSQQCFSVLDSNVYYNNNNQQNSGPPPNGTFSISWFADYLPPSATMSIALVEPSTLAMVPIARSVTVGSLWSNSITWRLFPNATANYTYQLVFTVAAPNAFVQVMSQSVWVLTTYSCNSPAFDLISPAPGSSVPTLSILTVTVASRSINGNNNGVGIAGTLTFPNGTQAIVDSVNQLNRDGINTPPGYSQAGGFFWPLPPTFPSGTYTVTCTTTGQQGATRSTSTTFTVTAAAAYNGAAGPASITLVSPRQAAVLVIGGFVKLSWTTANLSPTDVVFVSGGIDQGPVGGRFEYNFVPAGILASTGIFNFVIPTQAPVGPGFFLRVFSPFYSSADARIRNAMIVRGPTITSISSPTNATVVQQGTSLTVTWTAAGVPGGLPQLVQLCNDAVLAFNGRSCTTLDTVSTGSGGLDPTGNSAITFTGIYVIPWSTAVSPAWYVAVSATGPPGGASLPFTTTANFSVVTATQITLS